MQLYAKESGTMRYNTTTDRNQPWGRNDQFDTNYDRDRNRFQRFKRQFNEDYYNRNRNEDNTNRDNSNNRDNKFGQDPFRNQDPNRFDDRNTFDGNFDPNRFDDKKLDNETIYYEKFDIFQSVPKYGINHNLMFSVSGTSCQ